VSRPLALLLTATAALTACGGDGAPPASEAPLPRQAPSVGPGARFRPPSLGARATRGLPIEGLRCTRSRRPRFGAHVELFVARRVVLVAPGIGVAPPRTRSGAYVRGGRCWYPVRTREPTGLLEVEPGTPVSLGQLFAVWGQPLSRTRMAGFRGRVRAYVGGRGWRGDPRAILLRRHAQIVLEVGAYLPPHARYMFPPGL
jgi:hypothetical protein